MFGIEFFVVNFFVKKELSFGEKSWFVKQKFMTNIKKKLLFGVEIGQILPNML